jgi:GTP-binding protein
VPVVVAVNKMDTKQARENIHEFDQIGHDSIIGISASHGTSINDLLDAVISYLPEKKVSSDDNSSYKVAFLGKPNVGKSSIANALLRQERSIVSDLPGTTREAVSETLKFFKESITLTDTPGVRRKRTISGDLEPLMVKSTMNALKGSDIVVLVIDGSESSFVDQELKLAYYAFTEHYKALILVVNKHDLMTDQDKKDLERHFSCYQHLLKKIPILYTSVTSSKNIGKLMPLIQKIWVKYSTEIDNASVNRLLVSSLQSKPLYHKGEMLKMHEARVLHASPLTIALGVNKPDWFGSSQKAFFENIMRSEYDLKGVPIKFIVKRKL